jgi:hypothetical protein
MVFGIVIVCKSRYLRMHGLLDMGWVPKAVPLSDIDWISQASCALKLSIWPRKCRISNRLLWFKNAYRARRNIEAGQGIYCEDRWYSSEEFIVLKLKL